jgi:oligoendopeptidase F
VTLPCWSTRTTATEPGLSGLDSSFGDLEKFSTRHQGRVIETARELADICRELDSVLRPLHRATTLAEARLAIDSLDSGALTLLDRCDSAWIAVAEHAGFVEEMIARLPSSVAARMLAAPELVEYRDHVRRVRAAALPSELPSYLLADLDATADWQRLARQLLARISVDDPEGQSRGLASALPALYHGDGQHRARVCTAISTALEPEVELRAAALVGIANAHRARESAVGASDWLYREYLANDVEPAHIIALLTAVRDYRQLVHRYYRAKTELLGRALTDADRYAPVGAVPSMVSWPEACDIVMAAFSLLGGEVADAAQALLRDGAIDARPRPRKRRGALTFNLGGGDALVMLTFTGQVRDVLSLAHELGHAVHARMSGHLGPLNATVPTVLGETVALFTEALAAHVYAASVTDPSARLAILARSVEDQLVALFRQVALHDFEDEVHRAIWRGDSPDATTLGEWWLAGQRALYGPAVALTPGYRHWWSYLDNFFFAVGSRFAYGYGQVAASTLLARFLADPTWFIRQFADLLRAGATDQPNQLLGRLQVRVHEPTKWELGFSLLTQQMGGLSQFTTLDPAGVDGANPSAPGRGKDDQEGGEMP